MAQFNPKTLVPASQVAAFAKDTGNQRTMKEVALDNIEKQKALFGDKSAEGKRNFETQGDQTKFTIRVNNTALVLETVDVQGTKVEVKEMAAPTKEFIAALDYYKGRVEKGEFDEQLAALEAKRTARVTKMRATRSAKKSETK